ncbi:(Fe-S)-binding protein [Halochromatium roseum]|uniref:(Fe-S)-binding protein n=1 Tax=Halochromatium roseum TaxID=391920 RepID=UPI00191481DB|nr:(Fe-S)-binding protein [Halochromatium roseum]MBK5938116.1 ferredoxin [Halochromatium roseum]
MKTALDWSAYQDAGMGDAYADIPRHGGDFAKAVAVCINSRQCEAETRKGVMCPSFRVTGDPALSTGGRVRLLKASLNTVAADAHSADATQSEASLLDAALADPTLARAMDLCVACKGCKRECESNVDMALIKSEYLAQRVRRDGLRWRARLFAALPHWLSRYRPAVRWLIGMRNRQPWLAQLGQRLLGITAEVPLPEPTRAPFEPDPEPAAAPASALTEASTPSLPEVVLLVDCFGRHFEPEIPRAALRVLRAAGYRVHIAEPAESDPNPKRPLCCGRTYLAQGLVEQVADEARRLLSALLPHARAGRWIIGLEPSCLLSLRDDHLALGLGDAARVVAERSLLLEEFLAKELIAKRLKLPFTDAQAHDSSTTLVHGHCHQKAVGAMKSMRKVLKWVPGLTPEMIDAGCCGMAGTFGLEQEHAELSRQMAELHLLPQLRANPSAPVIANGFSCRQQIRAHTTQRPRHLAQVLADALELDLDMEPQQEVATQQAVEQNRATQNGRAWLRHHGAAQAKQGRVSQVTER